jgi:hypothetical protein
VRKSRSYDTYVAYVARKKDARAACVHTCMRMRACACTRRAGVRSPLYWARWRGCAKVGPVLCLSIVRKGCGSMSVD